jgi:hypothetical protein
VGFSHRHMRFSWLFIADLIARGMFTQGVADASDWRGWGVPNGKECINQRFRRPKSIR